MGEGSTENIGSNVFELAMRITEPDILMRCSEAHFIDVLRVKRLEHFPVLSVMIEQVGNPGCAAAPVSDKPDNFIIVARQAVCMQGYISYRFHLH